MLRFRPDLGHVEGIVPMRLGLSLGHHLNEKLPARKIARLDRVQQVAAVAFAILGDEGLSLRVGEVRDSLLSAKVELDPDTFIGGIDHREGMTAEKVHVAEAL